MTMERGYLRARQTASLVTCGFAVWRMTIITVDITKTVHYATHVLFPKEQAEGAENAVAAGGHPARGRVF
ncbi:MAG: hypothetical protein MI923_29990 [Phycisphaerales bacterium]|nr:hypothetical protein [Phycisphaerales bacterium]